MRHPASRSSIPPTVGLVPHHRRRQPLWMNCPFLVRSIRRLCACTVSLILSVAGGGSVSAHSELIDSVPATGAQVTEAPTTVRLTFSDLLGEGSKLDVLGADFQSVTSGPAVIDPRQSDSMSVSLRPLEPGDYSVQYHAVEAEDGHSVDGSYGFRVLRAPASPEPTLTANVADAASAAPEHDGPTAEADPSDSPDAGRGTTAARAGLALAVVMLLALVVHRARVRASDIGHGVGS